MGFLVLFSKASLKWFFIVSIILYSMVLTKVCWIFLTVSINLSPNFFVSVFPVSITMVAKRRKARVSFLGKFDFFCWNGITLVLTFVWFWVFFLEFWGVFWVLSVEAIVCWDCGPPVSNTSYYGLTTYFLLPECVLKFYPGHYTLLRSCNQSIISKSAVCKAGDGFCCNPSKTRFQTYLVFFKKK